MKTLIETVVFVNILLANTFYSVLKVLKSSRHSDENIYSINYCMLFFQPPEVISYDFSPKDVLFPVSLPSVIPMSRQWGSDFT